MRSNIIPISYNITLHAIKIKWNEARFSITLKSGPFLLTLK